MDSFNEIINLISEDKVQNQDQFFYSKIKQKIIELEKYPVFDFKIKKSHIIYSIAAGLILGLFVGRVFQHQIGERHKILLMENVLTNYYLNEIDIECYEFPVLKDLCTKERS